MIFELILICALLILPLWVKYGGINRLFYQNKRNAIKYENPSLEPITCTTSDGVKLGGFRIYPQQKS